MAREQPSKRLFKRFSYLNIFVAWFGFSGRVVMDKDYFIRIINRLVPYLADKAVAGKIIRDDLTAVGGVTGNGRMIAYYPLFVYQ
jgi:hypothetical protein